MLCVLLSLIRVSAVSLVWVISLLDRSGQVWSAQVSPVLASCRKHWGGGREGGREGWRAYHAAQGARLVLELDITPSLPPPPGRLELGARPELGVREVSPDPAAAKTTAAATTSHHSSRGAPGRAASPQQLSR